jgi:hypothetical protein
VTCPTRPSLVVGHVLAASVSLPLIQEYARHDRHADLIREGIEGTTGV